MFNVGDDVLILRRPLGVHNGEEFVGQIGMVVKAPSNRKSVVVSVARRGCSVNEEYWWFNESLEYASSTVNRDGESDTRISDFISEF